MKIDLLFFEEKKFIPVKQIDAAFVPAKDTIYLDNDGAGYKIVDIILTDKKTVAIVERLDDVYEGLHHTII